MHLTYILTPVLQMKCIIACFVNINIKPWKILKNVTFVFYSILPFLLQCHGITVNLILYICKRWITLDCISHSYFSCLFVMVYLKLNLNHIWCYGKKNSWKLFHCRRNCVFLLCLCTWHLENWNSLNFKIFQIKARDNWKNLEFHLHFYFKCYFLHKTQHLVFFYDFKTSVCEIYETIADWRKVL